MANFKRIASPRSQPADFDRGLFGAILSRRKSLRLWPRRWRRGAGAEFVQQRSDAESHSGSDTKPYRHSDGNDRSHRDRDTHCYCNRDDRSKSDAYDRSHRDRDTYCYCNRVNRSKSNAYGDGYDRAKSNSDGDSSFITDAGRYRYRQRDGHCYCYSDRDTDFGAAISTTQHRHARPH